MIVCKAFEGGNRQMILQQGKRSDDHVLRVCDSLRLNLIQRSAVAFALWQSSQYPNLRAESIRLLKANLEELGASGGILGGEIVVIHEETKNALVRFINGNEVSCCC